MDTGVSGRAAQKVAAKLAQVSRRKQVLCVTHLPQLAAMADTHFSVEKGERKGRTFTSVENLDLERREGEAYLGKRQIPWRTDSTNSGDAYCRSFFSKSDIASRTCTAPISFPVGDIFFSRKWTILFCKTEWIFPKPSASTA